MIRGLQGELGLRGRFFCLGGKEREKIERKKKGRRKEEESRIERKKKVK